MDGETIPADAFAGRGVRWVAAAIGEPVTSSARLPATSSTVLRCSTRSGRELVLRLFTNRRWLTAEPDLAAHEAAALHMAAKLPLPTPDLVAVDLDGGSAGAPAVLMTALPGEVLVPHRPSRDWLQTLADIAVLIAAADHEGLGWRYDPWLPRQMAFPVDGAAGWARAAAIVAAGLPDEPVVLLHRDHHPLNLLFQGSQLSAVVDWVNACVGPAPVDVAHCRLNLVAMYGEEAADAVRDRWCDRTGWSYNPIWDLVSALSMLPLTPYAPWSDCGIVLDQAERERRTTRLVRRALAELGA